MATRQQPDAPPASGVAKRLVFLIALGLLGGWAVRQYVVETVVVASASMQPTLYTGTHYLLERMSYRFRGPRRGEIIAFKNPIDGQKGFIKRVIATPGDQIELREKAVYINGKLVDEPFAAHSRPNERLEGDNLGPITVPANTVFVLGDNRDDSYDSSVWKDPKTKAPIYFLPDENITGRVLLLI